MIQEKYISWGNYGSPIRELSAYAARRAKEVGAENVYDFTLGAPSAEPPKKVLDTFRRLQEELTPTQLFTYAPSPGMESTRERVAQYLRDSFGIPYAKEDVYMTHGAAGALSMAVAALVSPGEEVLTTAPCYTEYHVYVEHAGGKMNVAPCLPDTFQFDAEGFEKALTPKTVLVILNSPNNPSGAVLSRESIEALSALLHRKSAEYGHPIYILADEPYRELVYGGVEVPFIPAFYENTVYAYSFSKSMSLPGCRIGFVAVSPRMENHKNVRAAIIGAARAMGFICLPPIFQLLVEECIGEVADLSVYDDNRTLIYDSLTAMGYTCVKPDGAFYLFLKTPGESSEAFCKRALEKDIVLVPGDAFQCSGYARLSYCVPNERIRRSLPAFAELAAEYGLSKD